MADLHERLAAAVRARMELARAATPGPWHVGKGEIQAEAGCRGRVLATIGGYECTWPPATDIAHIAANDPATILRHCERDLRVLERHRPVPWNVVIPPTGWDCSRCLEPTGSTYQDEPIASGAEWPCDEVRDLAAAYGVEVDDD